jgi:hypothetical protein
LQEKYKDKPVVFISIHTAEPDAEKLAARIGQYATEKAWKFLAAIDEGTMIENSVTSHAYGCSGFPTEIVIGCDGRIVFNSNVPVPGMEDIVGKSCDEITPANQVKIDAWEKSQFEAVGEKWPLPKDISDEEMKKILNRLFLHQLSKPIDEALSSVPAK